MKRFSTCFDRIRSSGMGFMTQRERYMEILDVLILGIASEDLILSYSSHLGELN